MHFKSLSVECNLSAYIWKRVPHRTVSHRDLYHCITVDLCIPCNLSRLWCLRLLAAELHSERLLPRQ